MNVKLASCIVLIPVLILIRSKIYVDTRDKRRGIDYQYKSAKQEAFNNSLPYFPINGNSNQLRAPIANTRISSDMVKFHRSESIACGSGCST